MGVLGLLSLHFTHGRVILMLAVLLVCVLSATTCAVDVSPVGLWAMGWSHVAAK